jgi:flagellar biosynthesis chaperone FliJ
MATSFASPFAALIAVSFVALLIILSMSFVMLSKNSKVNDMKTQIAKLESEKLSLTGQLSVKSSSGLVLEIQVTDLKSQLATMTASLDKVRGESQEYQVKLSDALIRAVKAESNLGNANSQVAALSSDVLSIQQKVDLQKKELSVELETEYGLVTRTKSDSLPEVKWVASATRPEIEFPLNAKTGGIINGSLDGPPEVVLLGNGYTWIKVTDPRQSGPSFGPAAKSYRLWGRVKSAPSKDIVLGE